MNIRKIISSSFGGTLMGYYIGEIVKLRNEFFKAAENGELAEAVKYGSAIIKLYKDNNDCKSLEYANDANNTAIMYDNVMLYDNAVELYKEAAEIRKEAEGENSLSYADTISNMAVSLSFAGKYKEAFQYHKTALKIREENLGENHKDTVMSLYNMGSICEDLDKNDRSLQYFETALKRAESIKNYPKDDLADIVIGCARINGKKGRYKKSIEFYEKALNILKDFSGEKNFFYLSNLADAASICDKARNYEKSVYFYKKTVDIRKKIMDKTHLDYITNLNALGAAYNKIGDYEKAIKTHEEVVNLIKSLIGVEHPYYSDGLNNMAVDYCKAKNFEKAIECNKLAAEAKKLSTGVETPGYAFIINTAGDIYLEMGNYKLAEEKYLMAKDIRKKSLGENDPIYINSFMSLANLYIKTKKYSKAAEYYYEALKLRKSGSEHDNMGISINLTKLSELMVKMGKKADALSFAQKALDMRKIQYGKFHPRYFRGLYYLAVIENKCGKYEQADTLFKDAMIYQSAYIGINSTDYKDTQKEYYINTFDLIEHYYNCDEPEMAYEYFKDATKDKKYEKFVDKNDITLRFVPLFSAMGEFEKAFDMLDEYKNFVIKVKGESSLEYSRYLKELGKLLICIGKTEKAEKILIKCLETEFAVNGNENSSADEISVLLGKAFAKTGDKKRAENYYKKVLKNPESSMYPKAVCDTYELLIKNGDTEGAKANLVSAKNAMEKSGDFENSLYADITYGLGKIYEKEKKYEDAERLYNISLSTRRMIKELDIYIKELIHLGNLMKKNGHKEDAASAYNEAALEILKQNGECLEYAKLISKLAKVYVETGKTDAAENFFAKAAGIYKKIKGADSDEYAAALYDSLVFSAKAGKAVFGKESFQSLMSVIEKNIYSKFRDEKYSLKIKKLYEKMQKN